MRLLHYLEIENFKRFGDRQRIELDHPAVLIGPNNSGKTSIIQALALWSQAVRTWYSARKDTSATKRTASGMNRLSITSVPVQKTRYFWHNTRVHTGKSAIPISITVGVDWNGKIFPLCMQFTHRGDELLYCTPDSDAMKQSDLLEFAASINIELLYPMSGIVSEEPILKPGRINVLLGQGETAQVLRNLCLAVAKENPDDWQRICALMHRFFQIDLGSPEETLRGSIDLTYRQKGIKEPLDIAMVGRGFQQLLLIFAYLYAHKKSVLLIDEPDAHLELLRQKQIYVLLRDIAHENESQVILNTHSEVVLEEALEHNLTLLLDGKADQLAGKTEIRSTLRQFGAEHYIKARERGYVLYVEGGTDVDMLRAMAERIGHSVVGIWDEQINTYYVQNNHPIQDQSSELERVEGGFGQQPKEHFNSLRSLIPGLRGLAILDNDGRSRQVYTDTQLTISYWRKYEAENYFITPDLLRKYAITAYSDMPLFDSHEPDINEVLDLLLLESIFDNSEQDLATFKTLTGEQARLFWDTKTAQTKLSTFAEEFFRRLGVRLGYGMLLKKGELHNLVKYQDPNHFATEVTEKLDLIHQLFLSVLTSTEDPPNH